MGGQLWMIPDEVRFLKEGFEPVPTQVHVQVIFPALTGLARDAAINTFTFNSGSDDAGEAMAALIGPVLTDFYNDAPSTDPIAAHIARSRVRDTAACKFKYYDITGHLNGTPAGPPFLEEGWTLGPYGTSNSLPEEVAIAASFHGSLEGLSEFAGGARPKARHRGRVFIGPLTDTVSTTDSPEYVCRPKPAVMGDIEAACEALIAVSSVKWVVWSRANAAVYNVVGGWVDNAFDTIRGRGADPSFRETFGTLV